MTGTERMSVMEDYGHRLDFARSKALGLLADTLPVLLSATDAAAAVDRRHINVVVSNPLGWARNEIVTLLVSSPNVEVTSAEGERVLQQLIPPWAGGDCMDGGERNTSAAPSFALSFVATLPAGAAVRFVLSESPDVPELPSQDPIVRISTCRHFLACPTSFRFHPCAAFFSSWGLCSHSTRV